MMPQECARRLSLTFVGTEEYRPALSTLYEWRAGEFYRVRDIVMVGWYGDGGDFVRPALVR